MEEAGGLLRIGEHPQLVKQASQWFSGKWHIPVEAYEKSMVESIRGETLVPQWYVMIKDEKIIAGLGVIDNDFHERKDLTPNVCAVYVEEEYRNQGIAGRMLAAVCETLKKQGIDTLYLITEHTSFYERYGWEYLCMVKEDSGHLTRMYRHKA